MYIVKQRAITGHWVPDGGKHIEYDDVGEAMRVALERHMHDAIPRRVVNYATDAVAVELTS